MRFFSHRAAYFLICFILISSCSQEQAEVQAVEPAEESQPAIEIETVNSISISDFDTTASLRGLMNSIIDPHATIIWQAVRYIVSIEGVEEETFPQSDEDWLNLRNSALTMIEAGNSMMIPGRRAAAADYITEFPDFYFTTGEIEQMIGLDPEIWNEYVKDFQFSVQQVLDNIERKDLFRYMEVGSVLNQTCDSCHGQYWYRQGR